MMNIHSSTAVNWIAKILEQVASAHNLDANKWEITCKIIVQEYIALWIYTTAVHKCYLFTLDN